MAYQKSRLRKEINDAEINQIFREIKNINEIDITKLSYVLSNWYKSRQGHEEAISKLETLIERNLSTMSPKNFYSIVKNLVYLYKNHYKRFNKEFLISVLAKFSELKDPNEKILIGSELSKLALLYKNTEINILEVYSNLLEPDTVASSSLTEFLQILQVFNNIYQCKFFSPIETEEFLEVCEVRIEKDLENMRTKAKFECLLHLIICSSKSEDLLKKLEIGVFSSLSNIDIGDFPKFFKYYQKRNLHDYQYLINYVYKPLFGDFMARIEQLHPKLLTSYLTTWKQVSSFQGLYCEKSVIGKLKVLIKKYIDFDKDYSVNKQTLHSILSLSNFTGFSENREIAEIIVKTFENSVRTIYEPSLISLAYELSLHPGISIQFWKGFNDVFPQAFKKIEKKGYLYGIYLNLSLQDPQAYKILKDNFEENLEEIKKSWVEFREMDLGNSVKSKFHGTVEKEIQKLGLTPVSEFYDNYFIDLALTKEKIAFEILGPGHYVYPYGTLNGKTLNKKRNLEKMGWKYVEIPFHLNKIGLFSVKKTIESVLPFTS